MAAPAGPLPALCIRRAKGPESGAMQLVHASDLSSTPMRDDKFVSESWSPAILTHTYKRQPTWKAVTNWLRCVGSPCTAAVRAALPAQAVFHKHLPAASPSPYALQAEDTRFNPLMGDAGPYVSPQRPPLSPGPRGDGQLTPPRVQLRASAAAALYRGGGAYDVYQAFPSQASQLCGAELQWERRTRGGSSAARPSLQRSPSQLKQRALSPTHMAPQCAIAWQSAIKRLLSEQAGRQQGAALAEDHARTRRRSASDGGVGSSLCILEQQLASPGAMARVENTIFRTPLVAKRPRRELHRAEE